jgi:hypothetical protein
MALLISSLQKTWTKLFIDFVSRVNNVLSNIFNVVQLYFTFLALRALSGSFFLNYRSSLLNSILKIHNYLRIALNSSVHGHSKKVVFQPRIHVAQDLAVLFLFQDFTLIA